ncbi:MAG TPA: hypothetical protein VNY27_12590 [Solirubrobacteraceae bacterium]|nr:hypothetical protein [Solirubrobacteraceae bacterium]
MISRRLLRLRRLARPVALAAVLAWTLCLIGAGAAWAGEPVPLGITKFAFEATRSTRVTPLPSGDSEIVNEPYTPAFTQAGGHPWALTSVIEFTTEEYFFERIHKNVTVATRDPKDIVVDLPPGLLGDPLALPSCSLSQAINKVDCPAATQVGVAHLRWFSGSEEVAPIVNVTPEPGQSAEFVLENTFSVPTVITGHLVRTDQGYGISVQSTSIPAMAKPSRVETTFWGVPADPSHDQVRGMKCGRANGAPALSCAGGGHSSGVVPAPFLTWPTDCAAGPEAARVLADSWEEPGRVVGQKYEGYVQASATIPAVTGCSALQFGPTVGVEPDTLAADEPVGLGVNLQVPLNEAVESNATPQLRNSAVTLPEGLSVSPGVVDGIQACNETGPEGININGPESEEEGLNGQLQLASGHCPDGSTVGTAEAITPFLPEPIKGHLYLARPACGGAGQAACTAQDAQSGRLYRLYLELGGTGALAKTGIHFKVALETHANPATGQLTSIALDTPQAPFSELRLHLNGGPRAPLDNPSVCGPAVTTADFTPWSAPGETPQHLTVTGTPDATPSSFYTVSGCSNPTPFNPGFLAGTVSPQAGAFSAFTMNLTRRDREQYVKGVQVHTPPGLLAMLSSVPLCPEAQANNPALYGECAASKIGTTRVASGAGSHPFEVEGNVYLTGPHNGAPFGLSIVTHAVAGPFNLGLVVVRARIDIDPVNSTATITTDETGPYALPQIVFGVPLRLKRITVDIDRPGFMFNPTNCSAQQVTANVAGNQNATAHVASPFAAAGCRSLAFQPHFTVSASGRTSKRGGASLDAKVTYPPFKAGSQANIAYVKVELPKQIPSRLTTLQKACIAAVFEANPASCPAASVIGVVRTTTPLLPVPLSGPVYFVSHGGEAFPSLVAVLQGDGVRVDLTGTTFISKSGVTSSTFKTVPDVPVSTFELYLPQGPYSALAANTNLCKAAGKLRMPSEFIAQNGAVLRQSTQIQVTGCGAHAARARQSRHRRRHR